MLDFLRRLPPMSWDFFRYFFPIMTFQLGLEYGPGAVRLTPAFGANSGVAVAHRPIMLMRLQIPIIGATKGGRARWTRGAGHRAGSGA